MADSPPATCRPLATSSSDVSPGRDPAGPPALRESDAVVTSGGELSRSSGYDVSRSLVLDVGTSEPVSVISSPTATTSRHPTVPGAVESRRSSSSTLARSAEPSSAQVMRVTGRSASPADVTAPASVTVSATADPSARTDRRVATCSHSWEARPSRSSVREPS